MSIRSFFIGFSVGSALTVIVYIIYNNISFDSSKYDVANDPFVKAAKSVADKDGYDLRTMDGKDISVFHDKKISCVIFHPKNMHADYSKIYCFNNLSGEYISTGGVKLKRNTAHQ